MFTHLLPTIVALYLFFPVVVRASPCVVFDANWNLLAFDLNGKDWNASSEAKWSSGNATDITASGRPPFDDEKTTCYLSQYTNAIYVANGDKSSPSSIYIYDATAGSWSKQDVTPGSFDPESWNAILDHDTNEFYALSHGELFRLDMGLLKVANSTSLAWVDVQKAPYASSYEPVMAIAQNHVFFLNVPGLAAGSADIFVIHFNFFQPAAQAFPVNGTGTIPVTHGQTASFFESEGVQQAFAFVPDDGSATYVLNVETNTTQIFPGPTTKDAGATYCASITSLVQLDSTGAVAYLPVGSTQSNASVKWSQVVSLANSAPATNSSKQATGSSGSSSPKQNGSSTTNSSSGTKSGSNDAGAVAAPSGILGGLVSMALLAFATVVV